MKTRNNFLWDAFCFASLFGIWPRFIEPKLLKVTRLTIPFPISFKILQISDLHFHNGINQNFLSKLKDAVSKEAPDLIAITGDFLCHGELDDPSLLEQFLSGLIAPFGTYAVLGNHDYSRGIGINRVGDYDILENHPAPFKEGFSRLFYTTRLSKKVADPVRKLQPHPELLRILERTSIQLLDNACVQVGDLFNIAGVGEHMAGRVDLESAFASYSKALPGIVLAHNPDAIPALKQAPGSIILCGHTHGGEVNLPWLRKRFTALENPKYLSGLFHEEQKTIYVSRGVGGTFPFRFNAVPEIVSITLKP
jgi:predicted MPP superfamily phosphohydrolase